MKWLLGFVAITLFLATAPASIKCGPKEEASSCGISQQSQYGNYMRLVQESSKNSPPEEYLTIADAQGVRTLKYQDTKIASSSGTPIAIKINPAVTYQRMYGFGASITESCLENMKRLSAKDKEAFFKSVFGRQSGAGFSYLRVPIGANDFSVGDYTLNDTPGNKPDPKLKSFNASKLRAFMEFIQEAKKHNPDIKIMMSPWTPPAWMKDTQALRGGQLKKEYYEAYAEYLRKTVDAFEKKGITIDQMTIMNEPLIGEAKTKWGFPQAYMSPEDQNTFIQKNLTPKLKGKQTKVLLHDHNWDNAPAADPILEKNRDNPVVQGVAYHCYGGNFNNLRQNLRKHQGVPAFNSECTSTMSRGGAEKDTFNWWQESQSVDAVKAGISGSLGWNLCLDEKGGPKNNGCGDCRGLITIDSKTNAMIFNPEFKALATTSKVIDANSQHIHSSDSGPEYTSVAFKNPDGSLALVLKNKSQQSQNYNVSIEGCETKQYHIPAGATLSMRWYP